jgi:hypothetical protein
MVRILELNNNYLIVSQNREHILIRFSIPFRLQDSSRLESLVDHGYSALMPAFINYAMKLIK